MNASAIVEVFPHPVGWQFYGPDGQRFIRCRGDIDGRGYVHFVVNENGRQYHRLAYGIERETTPEPIPVQGTLP